MPAGTSAAKDTSSLLLLQLYHFHAQAVGPVPEAKEHLVVQGRRLSEWPHCGGFGMVRGSTQERVGGDTGFYQDAGQPRDIL